MINTKVKFMVQYMKEDKSIINLIYILPLTMFYKIDNSADYGVRWRDTCNNVLHSRMAKSVLFLHNNSIKDRIALRKTIEYYEYTVTGIQTLPDGSKKRTSLDNSREEFLEDFFSE